MVTDSSGLGLGDVLILCCGGTCILGFVVFALFTGTFGRLFGLGNRFMSRPGGSFNNPNVRSGGRIGGTPGFQNPFFGSGGRVGGSGQGYSNPNEGSSGSIGGRSSSSETTDRGSGGGASFG